jgi:hypothetical protein
VRCWSLEEEEEEEVWKKGTDETEEDKSIVTQKGRLTSLRVCCISPAAGESGKGRRRRIS